MIGCDKDVVIQYIDRGKPYVHGENPSDSKRVDTSRKSNCVSEQMPLSEWKAMESGVIPCPPEERGGCGHGHLELKCILGENWVSKLKEKAENLVLGLGASEVSQISDHCPCSECSEGLVVGIKRKAADRRSFDNHLYCPSARDIQNGKLEHFQRHWIMGEPIVVRDVLELTSGLSWDPMVMWRAFRKVSIKKGSSDLTVTAVDCLDTCEVSTFYDKLTTVLTFSGTIHLWSTFSHWPNWG